MEGQGQSVEIFGQDQSLGYHLMINNQTQTTKDSNPLNLWMVVMKGILGDFWLDGTLENVISLNLPQCLWASQLPHNDKSTP